jgi:tRNA A37 methylthiotransferase MiaB
VSVPERKHRNLRLRNAAEPLQVALRNSKVGQSAYVLPEKVAKRDGYTMCRAEDYLAVLIPSEQVVKGQWHKVSYLQVDGEFLIAEITP